MISVLSDIVEAGGSPFVTDDTGDADREMSKCRARCDTQYRQTYADISTTGDGKNLFAHPVTLVRDDDGPDNTSEAFYRLTVNEREVLRFFIEGDFLDEIELTEKTAFDRTVFGVVGSPMVAKSKTLLVHLVVDRHVGHNLYNRIHLVAEQGAEAKRNGGHDNSPIQEEKKATGNR
jgi:hypothetical protein